MAERETHFGPLRGYARVGHKGLAKTQGAYNPERDEFKALEQAYMSLKDDLARIGAALGFKELPMWGDSVATVDHMVERIDEMVACRERMLKAYDDRAQGK